MVDPDLLELKKKQWNISYNIKDDVKEIKLFAEKNFKEYSGLVIQYMFHESRNRKDT